MYIWPCVSLALKVHPRCWCECAPSPKVTAHMSCVQSSADVPGTQAPISECDKIILHDMKTCKRLYNYQMHLTGQLLAGISLKRMRFNGQMLFTATLLGQLKRKRHNRGPTQVLVFVTQQHVQKLPFNNFLLVAAHLSLQRNCVNWLSL